MSGVGRLQGKVAIITGSSSGIGRAIALAFAAQGAQLVACADIRQEQQTGEASNKSEPSTDATINNMFGAGRAVYAHCDVSRESDVMAAVAEAVRIGGRLDILVNNAGIGVLDIKTHEMTEQTWDKAMNVHSKGTFLGCKAAINQFLKQTTSDDAQEKGAIVNIASIGGLVGLFECSAYCASKAAVLGLTRAMAAEYASQGIRSNAICPGYIDTSMIAPFVAIPQFAAYLDMTIPAHGLGQPQDVAEAAIWLASSRESRYVNGIALPVDGGFTAK